MKFTNGYWLTRPQYQIESPREVFDYKQTDNKLTLYAPFKFINERGDELNLGMSTIDLTSPVEGVIGVKLTHFDQNEKGPAYHINNQNPDVAITTGDDELTFTSGGLTARIPFKQAFQLDFLNGDHLLTQSLDKAQGVIHDSSTNKDYMREQLNVGVDDKVYGLGERFGNFVKNGQEVKITNQDGGTASEQSYKNIPFYLTDAGYGVFVDQPQTVDFEITSENVDRVQFSTEGQSLQYYVIYGPTPQEILHRYTQLTGQMQLPPAWSFGLWLTTSFTTDYSEKTVMKFIDGMKERNIPLDVFHFDCFWQKGFEWSNMEWDRDEFPDPASLIKKIHDRGIKVCVWINPYIAQKGKMFEEGKEKGYFVKRENGTIWQWDLWQAGNAFVDFTNPDAVKWYKSKLQALLDMGVDCFKTDFGERIPVDDAVFFDGSDPKREHNYYTLQYNQAVFETIEEAKGKGEAVVFARSATVGSQKYPVHWGGDALSTFKNMADTLHGGLSFLSSGFAFWSHDIGGFEDGPDTPTADLYKRWTQFGLLSSHSRYHGSNVYRVPWNFDDEAVENTRKYVNLKLSLMPYLYTQAAHNAAYGNPLMRPMWFDFTQDLTAHTLDNQYMLGSQILVAPVFNHEGHVNLYLPAGKWTSIIDDNEFYDVKDGKWLSQNYSELDLPVLARENTILLRNPKAVHADYDFTKDLDIHLYDMHEGTTSVAVVDQKGKDAGKVTVDRTGNELKVTTTGLSGNATIYVHENGKTTQVTLDGAATTIKL